MNSPALHPYSRDSSVLQRLEASSFLSSNPAFSLFQIQIDSSVSNFVENTTDWRSLAAMGVGGLAYRWGKTAAVVVGKGHVAAMPLRILSIGMGLGTEVTAFELTNRTLLSVTSRAGLKPAPTMNLWAWSGHRGLGQGLLSSLIAFSTLKSFGRLAGEENLIVQHGSQDVAMVLGHQLLHKTSLGEKPVGTFGEQLLHAEELNLQMGLGMQLAGSLAPGLHGLERAFDLALQSHGVGAKHSGLETESQNALPLRVAWNTLFPKKNSLLSLGPLAGLGDFFKGLHDNIGTLPLVLTGLTLTGLVLGKVLHSRYKASLMRHLDPTRMVEKTPSMDEKEKEEATEAFGILSPPKIRPKFLMSLADIILFDGSSKVITRVQKVEEGLIHPDANIRAYLLETLGELLPHLAMKDRLPRVKKIESMLLDPHMAVQLQALKSLAWSLQFLLPEERDSRFLKIESYWSHPLKLYRQTAVDLLLENLQFIPGEEKLNWIERMKEHLRGPHLEGRGGAYEALDQLDPFGRF